MTKNTIGCRWYVGTPGLGIHSGVFCNKQPVGEVNHKQFCAQHILKARRIMAAPTR